MRDAHYEMPENQIINFLGPKVHAIELHANKKKSNLQSSIQRKIYIYMYNVSTVYLYRKQRQRATHICITSYQRFEGSNGSKSEH